MVELLVVEENLQRNIYSRGTSNQIDIFLKNKTNKQKRVVVQTSTTKLSAFQKLGGRARQEARWESLKLF